jgi:short subunit dehydrogenase-like uncharacterized protein
VTKPPPWLIYGANGYTGRLIAQEAVRRGLAPILAGRNADRMEGLARELACSCRIFDLSRTDGIVGNLCGVRAVLHCAGPFSQTARPMLDACIRAGVHYLDITGEINVIELAATLHQEAATARVTLMPAVGMDVVPSDCLAAKLAERLPKAQRLELAISSAGTISRGTAATILEGLPSGGRVRIDGTITKVPLNWKTKDVSFRHGVRTAVTAPWGDVASAWHTTGIPNIEVYMAMPPRRIRWLRVLRPVLPLLRLPFLRALFRRGIRRFIAGPSPDERKRTRVSFWGRAVDARGNSVEATLVTPSGYSLTASAALACLEKVLAGEGPIGFATPAKAFGGDFILTIPGTEFRWENGDD